MEHDATSPWRGHTTASALNAERIKLEAISQNIANANVAEAPGEGPYQRKEVVFESIINEAVSSDLEKVLILQALRQRLQQIPTTMALRFMIPNILMLMIQVTFKCLMLIFMKKW